MIFANPHLSQFLLVSFPLKDQIVISLLTSFFWVVTFILWKGLSLYLFQISVVKHYKINEGTRWFLKYKKSLNTQAKSPRVNFTWNEFHVNFTWNFHVNFTWISREICFMWISRETVMWISRETRFTWNSCEIFHVNCRWIEFHMKFTWNMHLYFTWILWVEIYSRVSISGKKN